MRGFSVNYGDVNSGPHACIDILYVSQEHFLMLKEKLS